MSDKLLKDYQFIAEHSNRDRPPFFKVLHNGVEPEVPATLVKYYSLNKNSVDAVTKHQFYVAHPDNLNDPYDCSRYLIDYSYIPFTRIAEYLEPYFTLDYLIVEYLREKSNVINTLRESYWNNNFTFLGILSLCRCANNYHLWSYYTAHTGFNIEIATRMPSEFLGPFKIIYLPINEKQVKPTIQKYNAITEFGDLLETLLGNVLIKSSFWIDEAEWRYLVFSQKAMKIPPSRIEIDQEDPIERLIDYPPDVVTSITLAVRFFTVSEYIPDFCKPTKATLAVFDQKSRERYCLRKRLLDHIVKHKIPTFMMFEENPDGTLILRRRSITIEPDEEEGYWIRVFE